MELIAIALIVLIVVGLAATVAALRKDGLGHNPPVLVVVADRLSQREGSWRPFVAQPWARRWIPDPALSSSSV